MPKKRVPGVGVRWVSAEALAADGDLYWLEVSGGGSFWVLAWCSEMGEGAEISHSILPYDPREPGDFLDSPEYTELARLLGGVSQWETEREARRALAHLEVGMLAWETRAGMVDSGPRGRVEASEGVDTVASVG